MRHPQWLACIAMLVFCAGCGAQSEDSGGGEVFSLFKKKGAAASVTTVHADVGAPLVRQTGFPFAQAATAQAPLARELAIQGAPPQASWADQPIPGETTHAYIVEGSPRLALANVKAGRPHVEIWEIAPGEKPAFVRRRTVKLDPEQDSWNGFFLSGVARLPGNKVLLGVFYYAPQVKEALFLYDSVSGSAAKIAGIVPHNTLDRQKFFEAQLVAPDAVLVQYYTGSIRLAPEVYYNTPSQLRLFTPRYPQGVDILQLSAADGSIDRWAVIERTLWIQSIDLRERGKPKEFIWSLNLDNVLPR